MGMAQTIASRLVKPDPKASGFAEGSYDSYLSAASQPQKAPKGMTTAQMSTSSRDPWYSAAGQFALNRAIDLSDRPYEAFNSQRVAGLSGNERQAGALARDTASRLQPFYSRLSSGFSGENLSAFMNPYTDKVLGSRLRKIGDEYGRQMSSLDRNAAATDAFRTGRTDLARARANASRLRAIDDATAETEAAAYDNAQSAFFQQKATDMGAMGAISSADAAARQGLMDTGAAERSITQADLDFQYGQHLERRDWDINNLNNLLGAIGAVNSTAGTTETDYKKKPKKSTWGSILGVVGTAVGAMYGAPQVGGAIGGAVGGAIDG